MAIGFMILDRITGLTGTYRISAGGKRTVDGKTDDGGRMTVVMSVGGPSTGSGQGRPFDGLRAGWVLPQRAQRFVRRNSRVHTEPQRAQRNSRVMGFRRGRGDS
jgi:hypothetical protein